ncbi:MAG: DMT family transporter [Micrococcales bacterium]
MKKVPRIAAPALLAVAITWGAAFVLMKPAIEQQPFYDFLATRFTLATLVMILARPKVLREFNLDLIKRGVPLGVLLGLGYITQTIALELTTAAITGFLTGLYVVLTPLIAWIIFRKKIDKRVFIGVALAAVGLGLISLNGLTIEPGELWGILCAVFFAAHIVGLGHLSPGKNVYVLTVLQLGTMAVINWVCAIATDGGYQAPTNWDVWFAVIFTAVLATAVAFFVQTWAQSLMDASRVAIILTSEIVWAAAIAVAVGQEVLSLRTLVGGAIMLIAMLIVELPTRKNDELAQTHFV